MRTVVRAYHQNGGYNVVVLDWANLAFGNYLLVTKDIPTVRNLLKIYGINLYIFLKSKKNKRKKSYTRRN